MLRVNGREKIWLAIKRYLSAQRGCETWNHGKVVVVSSGVSLNAGKKLLVEARRLRLLAQQQFTGAIDIFNSCPYMVVLGKLQCGFGQVTVRDLPALQYAIAAPQQRGGPNAFREWPVIAH